MIEIGVMRDVDADPDVPLPVYATADAAGADLRANLDVADRAEGFNLAPGMRFLVPTGLRVAIPRGYEIQIRPRSGLALRHGVTCLNTPGTIDSDYRGPLGVILINLGQHSFVVEHGARIAQAIVAPVIRAAWSISTLDDTVRGTGGFGSTGTS